MKFLRTPALAVFGFVLTSSVFAAQIDLTVTGYVTDVTCLVNGSKSLTRAVPLPKVPVDDLSREGATAARTLVSFDLTQCAQNDLLVTFESGTEFSTDGQRLKNIAVNDGAQVPAKNVDIQVSDAAGKPINMRSDYVPVTVVNGAGKFELQVEYYATGVATIGPVKSHAVMTVAYK